MFIHPQWVLLLGTVCFQKITSPLHSVLGSGLRTSQNIVSLSNTLICNPCLVSRLKKANKRQIYSVEFSDLCVVIILSLSMCSRVSVWGGLLPECWWGGGARPPLQLHLPLPSNQSGLIPAHQWLSHLFTSGHQRTPYSGQEYRVVPVPCQQGGQAGYEFRLGRRDLMPTRGGNLNGLGEMRRTKRRRGVEPRVILGIIFWGAGQTVYSSF